MTQVKTANSAAVPSDIIEHPFLQELARQIRAQDAYGIYRQWSNELVLKPLILSKEQKRKISVDGEVDPATKLRIFSFYRAIAAQVEQSTGQISQVVIDLSHEGFGWALVFSGRLLLVARTLRDAQRFGFESLEKLVEEGEKLTKAATDLANRYPDVTRI